MARSRVKFEDYPFDLPVPCPDPLVSPLGEVPCQMVMHSAPDRDHEGCLGPTIVDYYSQSEDGALVSRHRLWRCGRLCVVLSAGERLVAHKEHPIGKDPNDERLHMLTVIRGDLGPEVDIVPGARQPSPPLPPSLCINPDGTPAVVEPHLDQDNPL